MIVTVDKWWQKIDLDILKEVVSEEMSTDNLKCDEVSITGVKYINERRFVVSELWVDTVIIDGAIQFTKTIKFDSKIYKRKLKLKELL